MNSYVGMTMVKKGQGQDDYFSQQSILPHSAGQYFNNIVISRLSY